LLFVLRNSTSKVFEPVLKEIGKYCEESISYSLEFIKKGLIGTKESSPKTSIVRFLTEYDEDYTKESYEILLKLVKHEWQVSDEIIDHGLFKKIFEWINEWLKKIDSPSSYNVIQSWIIKKLSIILRELETKRCIIYRDFVLSGGLLFFFNMIRIHSADYFSQSSKYFELSIKILHITTYKIMWNILNSFFGYRGEEYEDIETIRNIFSSIHGDELLFNHYDKLDKTESTADSYIKIDCLFCAVILCFIYAFKDFPLKFQTILPTLKIEVENSNSKYLKMFELVIPSAISLLATTPANRKVLYDKGFHSAIFNVLVKEDSSSDVKVFASQALCNMTCEESAERKNNILNEAAFTKLKNLMDKVISSSAESVANKGIAEKNALIIENIFLMISNILIGNVDALTPIMNSGFKSYILNHLSPDDDDEKRQTAGNIVNQQIAALRVLHSITFHQSEHISSLVSLNVLSYVKMAINNNTEEIAMCGVLYNIAVTGNTKCKEGEKKKNEYLTEYKNIEGLMDLISNAAKTGSTRTKQYAALILGQLYRNEPLKEEYKHIIQSLKTLKNDKDTNLSVRAQHTLEMVCESNCLFI
jgi:hypothetical protein